MAAFAILNCRNGAVDAQKLVISGQDLLGFAGGIIKKDEVLDQVHKVSLAANTFEQRFHVHGTRLVFSQTPPLVEVLEPAGYGAQLASTPLAKTTKAFW